jgi:nicotinamide-nucleotide adenylyltransferase
MVPPALRSGSVDHHRRVDPISIRAALDRCRAPGRPRLEVMRPVPPVEVLGLVPGSFDPMTVAHAVLAEALATDLTLFLYSPRTLPKQDGPGGASSPPLMEEEDRVASLLAYCRTRRGLGVALSSHGLLIDQAEAAAASFPGARLVFGVGSDKVVQILDPRWYRDPARALGRLFSLAEVAYSVREGDPDQFDPVPAASSWRARLHPLPLPEHVRAISSRRIREAVRRGEDVDAMVPPEVRPFVRRQGASP